jgi:hypothetical protein
MSISHATSQTSISTSTIFGSLLADVQSVQQKANEPTCCPLELNAGLVKSFWTPKAAKIVLKQLSTIKVSRNTVKR